VEGLSARSNSLPPGRVSDEPREIPEIAGRLRDAIEGAKASGRLKSQNDLEVKAQVGRGYVSRLVKGTRGTRMDLQLVQRLARALGVNYEWLAHGTGPRHVATELVVERDERYPNRGRAIARARAAKVDERAIARVSRIALKEGASDKSEAEWFLTIAQTARDLDEQADEPGRPADDF